MATTVKQLIEALKFFDPDDKVIMSKDGEGNYFRPFHEAGAGWMDEDGDYLIDKDDYDRYPDQYGEIERVVVLWPSW